MQSSQATKPINDPTSVLVVDESKGGPLVSTLGLTADSDIGIPRVVTAMTVPSARPYFYLDGNGMEFDSATFFGSGVIAGDLNHKRDVVMYQIDSQDSKLTTAVSIYHTCIRHQNLCFGHAKLLMVGDDKQVDAMRLQVADTKVHYHVMKTMLSSRFSFNSISAAVNGVLLDHDSGFGTIKDGPYGVIHEYIMPTDDDVRLMNRHELLRKTQQLARASNWNQELQKKLDEYAKDKIKKDFKGSDEIFYATPRGKAVKELIELNKAAGVFCADAITARTAYNKLVAGINKVIEDGVFVTSMSERLFKSHPMHAYLVKLAKDLKPVPLVTPVVPRPGNGGGSGGSGGE